MATDKQRNWEEYYKQTAKNPPSKLLVAAVVHLSKCGKVLELGAGTPVNTEFLLSKGFEVTAVDVSESSEKLFKCLIHEKKFSFIRKGFEEFEFVKESLDLISAQRALPFARNKELLFRIFDDIKSSLKHGGIFAGHFFGIHDTWCLEGKEMAFVSKSEVNDLLGDLKIITFNEIENDKPTASGSPHHWHIFEVIAAKK